MADDNSEAETTVETDAEETEATEDVEDEEAAEAVLDVEEIQEQEQTVDEIEERLDSQSERIEKLEDLLLDLSARAADDGGTGVCPDCHGPVVKVNSWFRKSRIKCTECGRVFHEY